MLPLLTAASSLVERIKINRIWKELRDGRPLWIKRRRRIAVPIVGVANRFFRLAGSPMQTLTDLAVWQRWEIDCFAALHGDSFAAFADDDRTICADEIPGVNLSHFLDAGTLTGPMIAAAARELRRAHEWRCDAFGGPWSHGDPHLGNFVYDEADDRARIIDFEVRHDRLPAEDRHADDVLVFLQDMMGRIAREQWLPSAHTFLGSYDRPEIADRLTSLLVIPSGTARLWWAVRTSFLPPRELHRRVDALRGSLEAGLLAATPERV